jgi:hypothetical protein
MTNTKIWEPKVEKELKKKSQTFKKLSISISATGHSRKYNKNYIEAVMNLLDQNKIVITGYQSQKSKNSKRSQSFNPDGLILDVLKKDQWDILSLFNELESTDLKKVKNALTELQNLFRMKFEEFEKKEINYWNKLVDRVESKTIDKLIEHLESEIEKERMGYENWKKVNPNQIENPDEFKTLKKLEKKLERYKKIFNKKRDVKVWYIKDLTKEEIIRQLEMQNIKSDVKRIYYPHELENITKLLNEQLYNKNFNTQEKLASEKFLENAGFKEPKKLEIYEINKRLRDVLFYISNENNKFLKNSFSIALSDEKDALEWFEHFINMSYISLSKQRLVEEINNKKPTYEDPHANTIHELSKKLENMGKDDQIIK